MADVRFYSSRGSKMDIRDQFCINCESRKKSKRDRKSNDKHKVFKMSVFSKRDRREKKF